MLAQLTAAALRFEKKQLVCAPTLGFVTSIPIQDEKNAHGGMPGGGGMGGMDM